MKCLQSGRLAIISACTLISIFPTSSLATAATKDELTQKCSQQIWAACSELALSYMNSSDAYEAERYYRIACDHDVATACTSLGRRFETADNKSEALELYKKGCASKERDTSGCYQMELLAQAGYEKVAIGKWLEHACRLGAQEACSSFGVHQIKEGDLRGNRTIRLACAAGSKTGCSTYRVAFAGSLSVALAAALLGILFLWLSIRGSGKPYPNIVRTIYLIVSLLMFTTFTGLATAIVPGLDALDTSLLLAINVSSGWLIILPVALRRSGSSFLETLSMRTPSVNFLLPVILISAGATVLCSEFNNFTNRFYVLPNLLPDSIPIYYLVIIAPFFEEFVFRGLILKSFLKSRSTHSAILISAVLFSIMHVNPAQLPTAFILGVIYAWVMVRTGNLAYSFGMHALNNASSTLLSAMGIQIAGFNGSSDKLVGFQPIWFDAIGVGFLIIGFYGFSRALRSVSQTRAIAMEIIIEHPIAEAKRVA